MEFEEFERMKIFMFILLISCWNFKNYFWTRIVYDNIGSYYPS